MPLKWFAFAFTIWLGGVVVGLLMEGQDIFGSQAATTASALPTSLWDLGGWTSFLNILFTQVFLLNFDIFKGEYQIVRILLLTPIIVTIMYGILITVGTFLAGLFRPSV